MWPDAESWSKACFLEKDPFHGGSFNGNACRHLLKKTDLLQAMIEADGCVMATPYVRAFQALNEVAKACFGMALDDDFEVKIVNFKEAFDSLPIKSVTPKIHAIFHHVPEFCRDHQVALGFHSEQASEAVHSKFTETWIRYKVSSTNPKYKSQLLRAVAEFNSYRI